MGVKPLPGTKVPKTPKRAPKSKGVAVAVAVDDSVWQRIQSELIAMAAARVQVGVLASKGGGAAHDAESGLTMVEIMAIHEFGSPAANIPERAPIRTTFVRKQDEFGKLFAKAAQAVMGGMTTERALEIVGVFTSTEVKKTITAEEHLEPALKPATIARKGSDRPLVDTGRLVNAITYEVIKG
jgi:hypothetical protein